MAHIQLDASDALAALLAIETDPATRVAISAALNERRSVLLVIAHQDSLHGDPAWTPVETGPTTQPMKMKELSQ